MGNSDVLSPVQQLEILIAELRHIGRIQVDAEAQYVARSNNITVLQGLLAVAAGTVVDPGGLLFLGVLGSVLSVVWFLVEQRNQLYFSARGAVLEDTERAALFLANQTGLPFPPFWTSVPSVANAAADAWYKKVSAQTLQRKVIPITCLASWLIVSILGAIRLYASLEALLG